jgi:RimJ/RimL family protein N-acetyltransferase
MPKRDLTPYQGAKRALRVSDENWKAHGYGGWVIRDKSDGQPVGSCDLNSEELGEVELGYFQAKAYWGKRAGYRCCTGCCALCIRGSQVGAPGGCGCTGKHRLLEIAGTHMDKK